MTYKLNFYNLVKNRDQLISGIKTGEIRIERKKRKYHQTEEGIKEMNVFDEQCIGRISEVQKNSYLIRYLEKEIPTKLSGKFYKEETMFPVVGDYVTFRYNPR